MLALNDVTKTYPVRGGDHTVLNKINLTIESGEKVGVLGLNGSGKTTLVRLIADVESPTSGDIHRGMKISWPLAFSGGMQVTLTGEDNVRFICRIYNADYQVAINFVREFSELGKFLKEPVKNYSAGMFSRLAFAISMVIDFDCYLIDEVLAVGDQRFQEKCNYELFDKRGDRAMIIVSHIPSVITKYCDKACLLDGGNLELFDNTQQAYDSYQQKINA